MSTVATGQWLNQYVAPQLLQEFKNYKDDFIAVLQGVPAAAVTADGVRWNKLINNVNFYVNNSSVFTPQKMTGEKIFVEWEKYDTDPTAVDDAEIRYLAYDKRSEVRIRHTESMKLGIRDHVMWKLAPSNNASANMPVIRTTGANDGTGRLRLTFENIVKYLETVKKLNLPNMNELYMILCPEHVTDLILDNDSAKFFSDRQIFYDMETGKVRSIMGFKFFENNAILAYDNTGAKKPKGAVLNATDRVASLMFYAPETVYHIESVKILYKPEIEDTRSADPTSEFRLQTYGLVDRRRDIGFGAVISGIAS